MFKTKTIARMLAATSLLAMTALAHAQSMDRVHASLTSAAKCP